MRPTALLVLAALLAAGCTQPSTPAADSGSASGTDGGQGVAVGEPNPGHPGGGMLVRPAHAENTSDGLRIVADESASGMAAGGAVTFTYNATNMGADAVTREGCERPYAFTLHDSAGRDLALDPPMAHCMMLSYRPLAAGAAYAFSATWNGTYADGDRYVQAPQGLYTFTATFTAYRGADSDQRAEVSVALPVSIVAMGAQ